MFEQNPLRCRHDVVDYNWVTPDFARIYCIKCGEELGTSENTDKSETFITGIPRKLTNTEKKLLR